jgi:Zn-dependent peptidase ImmA (M78 family)
VADKVARSSRIKPGQYAIRYRKGDIRAHTRIAIAREIARIILLSERDKYPLSNRCETLSQAEIFDFANALLVPREALALEIQKTSTRVNMVKALADLFWVPKSVIRARLSTILLETADNSIFEAEKFVVHAYDTQNSGDSEVQEEFLDEVFPNELSFNKKTNTNKTTGPSSVH